MGKIGEKLDIDFVVSTGDNFYDNGLTSDLDPAFEESFSKIYTAKSLQKQWYSGNLHYRFLDLLGFRKNESSPFYVIWLAFDFFRIRF